MSSPGLPRPYGRYVLEERIAMGGMAEIFRAKTATTGFDKRVCIKRILPHFLSDEEFVSMFRDEAKTAGKLQHGNVVQVFDFGNEEGTLYLAMEFVDGADLRRLIENGKRKHTHAEIGEVVQIGIDVSRGLYHAHTMTEQGRPLGIVHRDISPHNILVSRAGEVKVTDFGIAKAAERSTQTSTGIVKGKVAYMAPEQAEGRAFDHRLDQFAVGIVLWEAITGVRLFAGDNDIQTLRNVVACQVPSLLLHRPDAPPALDEILKKTLAKNPADRFSDMRALEMALSRLLYSGAVDPATADVRNMFARMFEEPVVARRTQIATPADVLPPAASVPQPAAPSVPTPIARGPQTIEPASVESLPPTVNTQTTSDPARLLAGLSSSTDREAQLKSDPVASVFSSSSQRAPGPMASRPTEGAAGREFSNPLAQALLEHASHDTRSGSEHVLAGPVPEASMKRSSLELQAALSGSHQVPQPVVTELLAPPTAPEVSSSLARPLPTLQELEFGDFPEGGLPSAPSGTRFGDHTPATRTMTPEFVFTQGGVAANALTDAGEASTGSNEALYDVSRQSALSGTGGVAASSVLQPHHSASRGQPRAPQGLKDLRATVDLSASQFDPQATSPGDVGRGPTPRRWAAALSLLVVVGVIVVVVVRSSTATPATVPVPAVAAPAAAVEPVRAALAPTAPAPAEPVADAPPKAEAVAGEEVIIDDGSADPVTYLEDDVGAGKGKRLALAKSGFGTLRLVFDSAVGWANVSEKGKQLAIEYTGDSPLKLPIGKHRLKLTNPDAPFAKELDVEIVPGKLRVYSAKSGRLLNAAAAPTPKSPK